MQLIVPVLCGSALDHIGVQPLLDAVTLLSAQPGRRAAGRRRRSRKIRTAATKSKPASRSRRAVLRAGVQDLTPTSTATCTSPRLLRRAQGKQPRAQPGQGQEGKRAPTLAHPGRTAASRSTRSRPATSWASSACATRSPATRCAIRKHPILLETIQFPETVISMAIEPESSTERKKLADMLEMMKRQDPDVSRP